MSNRNTGILTIGMTGMLAGATRTLADQGPVWVVARHASQFCQACQHPNLTPIDGDYNDPRLTDRIPVSGIHTIIAWIHGSDWSFLERAVERCQARRVLHICGSSSADPSTPIQRPNLGHADYYRVILGFVIENNRSRWLTHEEISSGVLAAVRNDAPETVVGTVEPWAARPSRQL